MLALRREGTEIGHEDFMEGITQVQAKTKLRSLTMRERRGPAAAAAEAPASRRGPVHRSPTPCRVYS